ncbi:MAG: PIG-L deacetylase family protein [Promethearchaeota archaeon]
MPKVPLKRLLVIAAHPDDETFGCGGTIAQEANREAEVTVCCLTGTPTRHKELAAACEIIGAKVIALKGKDLQLTVPEVTNALIPIIQETQPEVIVSHSADDYHPDHKVAHQAVKRAAEWAGHSTKYKKKAWRPKRLFSMEINTLLAYPTRLVDISEIIELKTQAISEYQSQLKKTDEYYLMFNLQKARLRGIQAGCEYAEAFREELLPVHGPFYHPTPIAKTIF